MNYVKIIDNFFDDEELKLVLGMLENIEYSYGHESSLLERDKNFTIKFFSAKEYDVIIKNSIFHKIENNVNKKLQLKRTYIHIQTFGQDGLYHIDDFNENTYTFCVYINNIKTDLDNANGEFLLKLPNDNKILSIDSVFNRGIFFPSTFLHKGMPYNRYYYNDRVCITFKFQEI
jgi:hypothetical protein